MARITLWGMYQYDDTLMDGLVLPNGMERGALIDLIWTQCGELYPYYQVPPRVKASIGYWSRRRLPEWQRMWDALQEDYNPIHNYDRYEKLKETPDITRDNQKRGTDKGTSKHTGTDVTTLKGEDTTKQTGTDTTQQTGSDTTKQTGTTTTDVGRSAFNESPYTPVDHTTESPDLTTVQTPDLTTVQTPDLTTVYAPDEQTTYKPDNLTESSYTYGEGWKETETGTRSHDNHVYGNIGVTTSQQMVQSELELRKFDIYKLITDEFEREFCVGVY